MKTRPGSTAAGEQKETDPVAFRQTEVREPAAGDEPLLVHHHLHAPVETPLSVQKHLPRGRRKAPHDLADKVAQLFALQLDLGPPTDRTRKGRKPDGLDDDLHASLRPLPAAPPPAAAIPHRLVVNSTSPPMGQFRRPVCPVGPSVPSAPAWEEAYV